MHKRERHILAYLETKRQFIERNDMTLDEFERGEEAFRGTMEFTAGWLMNSCLLVWEDIKGRNNK